MTSEQKQPRIWEILKRKVAVASLSALSAWHLAWHPATALRCGEVHPDVLDRFRTEAKRRKVGYETLIDQVLAE